MLMSFFKFLAGAPAPVERHVSTVDPMPTSPLRKIGEARNQDVSGVSARVTLTSTCEAVSMTASGCNVRYLVGGATVTAVVTSHRLLDGERLDMAVDPGSSIAVIAESGTGNVAISELA